MPIGFDDDSVDISHSHPASFTEIKVPEDNEDIGEPEDVYVGGSREEEEIKSFKAQQAQARVLDSQGDAELRQTMAMLMAKLERQDQILRQIGRNIGGLVLPEEAANSGFASMERELRRQLKGKKSVRILIHTSDRLTENWKVPLRVNGNTPIGFEDGVPRGQVVELPVPFVEVLQHAVISGWQKLVEPDGSLKSVHVHQLRYPFSILS